MKPYAGSSSLILAVALVAPVQAQDKAGTVTFSQHVASIIYKNCTSCHRKGEAAPFVLETYRQVRKRGKQIEIVVKDRFMPPWLPVKGHGDFAGERRLKKSEIDTISKWVKNGMPEGDPTKLPPMPKYTKGWQLGEPDMVVKMPKGYPVPAGGPDIYRSFVIPLDLQEDKWLTAIEVRASARNVLHHIIYGMDTTGRAREMDGRDGKPGFNSMRFTGDRARAGSGRDGGGGRRGGGRRGGRRGGLGNLGMSTSGLGGWAVGGQPRHLPMGLARKLPKGADLVLQSHLAPQGKEETEQTTLGLYFAKKPPKRTMVGLQMPPFFGVLANINIPAGKKDFEIKDSFELPVDTLLVTIGGHAHQVCAEMQVFATPPRSKKEKSIFWINKWDFDWQNRYQYKRPMRLKKGTKIEVVITYDNSADNPNNPNDPPKKVRWGQQSDDEMGSVTLLLVAAKEKDSQKLQDAINNRLRNSFRGDNAENAISGIVSAMISRLRMMDKNDDGTITRKEAGEGTWRMARRADLNGDEKITEKEIDEFEEKIKSGEIDPFGGRGRRRRR